MARTGVTYDDVAQAATKLLSMGESLSVEKVRSILKTGSNTTIGGHLKRWREQRSQSQTVALPEALPKALLPPLETLWHTALECSDERFKTTKESFEKRIEALTTERDTWRHQSQETEQALNGLRGQLEKRTGELNEERQNCSEQGKQISLCHQKIERLEVQLCEREAASEKAQQLATDQMQQLESEHQRALDHWQGNVENLKHALEKEQQRADQSEQRWMKLIDQSKLELKQHQKKHIQQRAAEQVQQDQLKSQVVSLQEELSQKRLESQQQHGRSETLKAKINALSNENANLTERLAKAEDSLQKLQENLLSISSRVGHGLNQAADVINDQS